jgi:hypothetical protein
MTVWVLTSTGLNTVHGAHGVYATLEAAKAAGKRHAEADEVAGGVKGDWFDMGAGEWWLSTSSPRTYFIVPFEVEG